VLRRTRRPFRRRPEAERTDAAAAPQFDPGELVDMMLVGSEADHGGPPEVHLVFRSDVLGGLHLVLTKHATGLRGRVLVEDASAKRNVAAHLDDLVAHLRGRGLTVDHFDIEIGSSGSEMG
jgi:hypothetical protein